MILRNRTCPKNKEFCVFPKKTCPKNKEFHEKWLHNRFLILGGALYYTDRYVHCDRANRKIIFFYDRSGQNLDAVVFGPFQMFDF